MKISAGIIPFRIIDNKLEFFLGHPGGPYWRNQDIYFFLKGGIEKNENLKEAAIREFEEESSIELSEDDKANMFYLGCVKQNSKKIVHAFGLYKNDIDCDKCHSNTCEVEYPSKSGNMITIPEMDKYQWFMADELKYITNEKHLVFYDRLKTYLIYGNYSE